MDYKCSCVVDAGGAYKGLVWVRLEPDGDGQILYYTLLEGEYLVDTIQPVERTHAGAAGFVHPRWNGEAWEEGATPDEIAAWELEHPAPPSPAPTVESRIADLEDAYTAMMFGGEGI